MNDSTIADASGYIDELLIVLDNAYWEAATIERKDAIYSILSLLQEERAELSKLSIQDHHLRYEPITQHIREIRNKLNYLRKSVDECVMRAKTAAELERLIVRVTILTN